MDDKIYSRMLIRRRFCKRVVLMGTAFIISFYISVMIFGDLKVPRVMRLTDLHSCPACYGLSICPELYSNQIIVERQNWQNIFFNAKNIYYGYTKSNRRVVLKKLAHNSEHNDFDSKLCKTWGLKRNCKPVDLLNVTNVEEKILKLVQYNFTYPEIKSRKGLIFCPYPDGIYDFIKPALYNKKANKNYQSELINVWTMLTLNPEPIVLQNIPKSKGWRTPAFGGVCGRLEMVAHEGEPLSALLDIAWYRKIKIALQIIDAAMDFTFKHDRFRFYFMDWSADNIVVNEKDEVSFVDLEDVIVLDKHISPRTDLPYWYKRYDTPNMGPEYSFSIQNLCMHHLSDHNLYAACYVLAGAENPFLYPLPESTYMVPNRMDLVENLANCLRNNDRFRYASTLRKVLEDSLKYVQAAGYGAAML